MSQQRVSVWMGTSAAILAAASLAACNAPPPAPLDTTVAAAPEPAVGTPMASVEGPTAMAAGDASSEAAAVQAAPGTASGTAAPIAPTPAAKAPAAPPQAPAAKAAATPAATPASAGGDFVNGPGKAVVEGACSSCHGPEQVTSQRRSKAAWGETVEKMISYGAAVSDAEFDTIVAYLARHYGTGS